MYAVGAAASAQQRWAEDAVAILWPAHHSIACQACFQAETGGQLARTDSTEKIGPDMCEPACLFASAHPTLSIKPAQYTRAGAGPGNQTNQHSMYQY